MNEVISMKSVSRAKKIAATDAGVNRNGEALENWTKTSWALFTEAVGLCQELITFSTKRINAHLDTWQALANCRNPQEAFECQKTFMETATTQYADEMKRIAARPLELTQASRLFFASIAGSERLIIDAGR